MTSPAVQEAVERLRRDREHGAAQLAGWAVDALVRAAQESRAATAEALAAELRETGRLLAAARPAMVALANAMGGLLWAAFGERLPASADDLRRRVRAAAHAFAEDAEEAGTAMARHAAGLLHGQVMTLSYSSTVVHLLRSRGRRHLRRVVVLESRPLLEGRTTARLLAEADMAVAVATDAQAAHLLWDTDVVLVGADAVTAQGEVLNKAGTALLAYAAHARSVPFYVACETLKVAWPGWVPHPERDDPAQVWPDPAPGVEVENVMFDLTPARLVTGLITEEGVLAGREIAYLVERARRQQEVLTAP